MRMKREVELLEARAHHIVFPSACDQFSRYRADLTEVIEENCGYGVAKTLKYDEYEHTFNVRLTVSGPLLVKVERNENNPADKANVELTAYSIIDPREPLGPQIEQINLTKTALQDRHNLMSTLLLKTREGYKMAKLGADEPL